MDALIRLREIAKKNERTGDYLFRQLSAEVREGQSIALLAGSGQGKSTLLRIMARLDGADEGTLELQGRPAEGWAPPLWRQRVCYVAQQPVMLPGTVEHNLRTVSMLHGKAFEEETARKLMESLGLSHLDWAKPASDLSGGEKQRVALARSMLLKPKLLLLDETTSSLDPASKAAVQKLLVDWGKQEGIAQVWVTHDLDQAREVSEEVWFLGEGKLLEKGATEHFFREPGTEQARRFLQSSPLQSKEVEPCPTLP